MSDLEEIKLDVKEIRKDQITLISQGAVHNEILRTHESRSLALQAEQAALKMQLSPIKRHVEVVDAIAKVAAAIFIGVLIRYIVLLLGH